MSKALVKPVRVVKDAISDPTLIFAYVSDPLIFMTPEHLGVDIEHADVMNGFVIAQAATVLPARLLGSYIHAYHPGFAETNAGKFVKDLPLRISGYTHLGMGAFLLFHGQIREAAIAVPLGFGNLKLTGDMDFVINLVKPQKSRHGEPSASNNPLKTLGSAFKDPSAHFAAAQFAVLTVPMAAVASSIQTGKLDASVIVQALPAVPLIAATWFIGRNVRNNERDNRADPSVITIHNEGFPTMLVGATATVGGLAGLCGLYLEGELSPSFNSLNSGINNFVSHTTTYVDDTAPLPIQNPDGGYVAGLSCAAITIGAAYVLLENRFGTFFKKNRPTVKRIAKNPEAIEDAPGVF